MNGELLKRINGKNSAGCRMQIPGEVENFTIVKGEAVGAGMRRIRGVVE